MPFDEDKNTAVPAAAIADLTSGAALAGLAAVTELTSAGVGEAFSEETLDGIVDGIDGKINAVVGAAVADATALDAVVDGIDAKINAILAALRAANIIALD